ncbi:stage 0 sporulation family protein [candidate division CSSED10-310 bacterium]|uniref:Stage 0 sporulation family protein n=1 Tax=candidate division CSSED10-310 bacterium TaxID=2855610 RepID=A0ABV6Z367_UNCC1
MNSEDVKEQTEEVIDETIISVSFPNRLRLAYFGNNGISLAPGDHCMVQTDSGLQIAKVDNAKVPLLISRYLQNIRPIVRKATPEDIERYEKNQELEQQAYNLCIQKIKERTLPMKLVKVRFYFDRSKAIFYFTADGRVDFRELVKDLAYEFKTRIEMRQIGVRDEAKMIGGYGCCGLTLCCCTFLKDFEPVSIRMAKEQNLTLIPSKISGLCGRLMCCLMYEFETYREIKKQFPKVGKKITTTHGEGKVARVNIVRESLLVDIPDKGLIEVKRDEIIKKNTKNTPKKKIADQQDHKSGLKGTHGNAEKTQ